MVSHSRNPIANRIFTGYPNQVAGSQETTHFGHPGSKQDDVVPFDDSLELIKNSGLTASALIEIGSDHRLADPEPLQAMLEACERTQLVDVTVYYLEMMAPSGRSVPAPRDGLTVVHAQSPTVSYYRSLYDSVGKDYYWLSRRKLSDAELAAIIHDPLNDLHVLQVDSRDNRRRSGKTSRAWISHSVNHCYQNKAIKT